jgi:hypothetical protein
MDMDIGERPADCRYTPSYSLPDEVWIYAKMHRPCQKILDLLDAVAAKEKRQPKAGHRRTKTKALVSPEKTEVHGGERTASSGLAGTLKKQLSAWIKQEKLAQRLRKGLAELPVGPETLHTDMQHTEGKGPTYGVGALEN